MLRLALGAACLAGSACVIVYDADDLRKRDAAPADAVPIDALPIDANPGALAVTDVTPSTLLEGVGADGGRPAVLLVEGDSLVDGQLVVTAAFTDGAMEALPVEVSAASTDSTRAALALAIPVDPTLAAGASRTLRLTFRQPGAADVTHDLTVSGLDELTLTAGTVAVTSLAPRYARVTVEGDVHFTGATPAVVVATGGITLGARLDADAITTTPGPHGCAGGLANSAGACGVAPSNGGGMQGFDAAGLAIGTPGDGGGGGGFGENGTVGAGTMGGAPGVETGNDMLVPIVTPGANPGNRGNGGGGGGNPSALGGGAAGPGGAGGGVLVVAAGGVLTVADGALRAAGGAGGGVGGGGGGGSGGAILVRAFGGVVGAPGAWIAAPGGGGGNAANDGGNGGAGRIRIDAPGALDAPSVTPVAKRGPAWAIDTPLIVREPTPTLTLFGEPGKTHGVRVDGAAVTDVQIGFDGQREVEVSLAPGANTVCALWTVNATEIVAPDEARSCVDVVYLP